MYIHTYIHTYVHNAVDYTITQTTGGWTFFVCIKQEKMSQHIRPWHFLESSHFFSIPMHQQAAVSPSSLMLNALIWVGRWWSQLSSAQLSSDNPAQPVLPLRIINMEIIMVPILDAWMWDERRRNLSKVSKWAAGRERFLSLKKIFVAFPRTTFSWLPDERKSAHSTQSRTHLFQYILSGQMNWT